MLLKNTPIVLAISFFVGFSISVGEIILEDNFDDNNLKSNSNGLGLARGWLTNTNPNGRVLPEENGVFPIVFNKTQALVQITTPKEDEFDFWNDEGVTIEWSFGVTNIPTGHRYGAYLAYRWQFGIQSAKGPNNGYLQGPGPGHGAFWININHRDGTSPAKAQISILNKEHNGEEHPENGHVSFPNQFPGSGFQNYKGETPIRVTLKLNRLGWEVTFSEDVSLTSSGNWTTDLGPASMTDEWEDGAMLIICARQQGIDGKSNIAVPNTGSLDKVLVKRNTTSSILKQDHR